MARRLDVAAALATWVTLTAVVTGASEADCVALLAAERRGGRRKMCMLRIHSRLNRVRAKRERDELRRIAR